MALTKIFDFIGAEIKARNLWLDNYAVNAIQLPNKSGGLKGEIVNFIGDEKEYLGLDDTKGSAFYIRTTPVFSYNKIRALTSCLNEYEAVIPFKFVFFAINQDEKYDPFKLESNFINSLRSINFGTYTGIERKVNILIQKSNTDFFSVFKEEIGKDYSFGANSIAISIEAQLKFITTVDCEPCNLLLENCNGVL